MIETQLAALDLMARVALATALVALYCATHDDWGE